MTDTYKVIQADIDAAERHYPKYLWRQEARDDLAIAFAKHREDTEALIVGWLREQHDMRLRLHNASGLDDDHNLFRAAALGGVADAIARGDHHTNNTPGD